jgi:hypothetical protein
VPTWPPPATPPPARPTAQAQHSGSGSTRKATTARKRHDDLAQRFFAQPSRTTPERKAASTRRSTTAKRSAAKTNARAASRNASRATARTQTTVAREAAEARDEAVTIVQRVGDAAERTVLTYVGATLTARDAVAEVVDTYTDSTKVKRSLKGFERRGHTARNRVERELKRRRTRIERELRQRTNRFERDAKTVGTDARRLARDARKTDVVQSVNLLGATVENVAQGTVLGASKAAREVTGRVVKVVA